MKPAIKCIVCQAAMIGPVLSLGELTPCNRFESQANAASTAYPLSLRECRSCGLIQLFNPPPVEVLIPRVPWIRYNEPDAHLEAVSAKLLHYLNNADRVYGVGPFDQPLLKNLENQGLHCETLALLSMEQQSNSQFFPYLETLQACLQPPQMQKQAKEKGRGDLVVCRYLLEHCRDPLAALLSFRSLLTAQGLALIEVPDSSKFLAQQDYSFIWEEHVCYFTEASLRKLIHQAGYKLLDLLKFPGQLEDALVAVVQPAAEVDEIGTEALKFPSLFDDYAAAFAKLRAAYQQMLTAVTAKSGKIAIFGAGHQAMMFINALGLHRYISYFVDDDVNKQAYFSPGANLPIVSSAKMLADDKITTCLLAVSPAIEGRIQEKCQAFLQRGGKMYSIFPGSKMDHLLEESICV